MSGNLINLLNLISAVCFIFALKGLASPKSARSGNHIGVAGMLLAIGATLLLPSMHNISSSLIAIALGGAIGIIIAVKIRMTAMPQLVAAFHSLVGLAAVFVAFSSLLDPESYNIGISGKLPMVNLIEMSIGSAIGAITFSGSIIAFGKLQGIMPSRPIKLPLQQLINIVILLATIAGIVYFVKTQSLVAFVLFTLLSFLIGVLLITPVGGADMPVIVSMLNSYSGWAAAGIGFTLNNSLLIITGALVGASGAILSHVMCAAMNRSLLNVIFGAFLTKASSDTDNNTDFDKTYKISSAEDAAFMLKNANSVIIVPGYGMAVAQAQHAIKEIVSYLQKEGISVKFAIHPVAGRMPGHMNVLLAEANIDYDLVHELEDINREFSQTDVVLVIGANDVTNPAAKNDPASPIYGMPILDVESARTIYFVKRSMNAGYAGIENELFYRDNTNMIFGDAKKVAEDIAKALEE